MSSLAAGVMAPFLRAARRAKHFVENETFRPYLTRIEVEGERFQFRIADPVGERWYGRQDWSHFNQIAFLKQMTRPEEVVFFCGAHHGLMCLPLARRLNDSRTLTCFDAHPRNARILGENLRLNGFRSRVYQRAVGARPGEAEFVDSGNAALAAAGDRAQPRFRVRMSTLDELCEELGVWPTLVVLDIEGAEIGALEAAPRLIARRPKWQIEVHAHEIRERFGEDPNRNGELLGGLGYQFLLEDDDRGGELRPADGVPLDERVQLYAVPAGGAPLEARMYGGGAR